MLFGAAARICAHAQFLLQRFYTQASLRVHCTIWAVGGVILLCCKIAGETRNVRGIANVLFDRIVDREELEMGIVINGKRHRRTLDFYGAEGYEWKMGLIKSERHILKELGFRVSAELAHKYVLVFCNTVREKAGGARWTVRGSGRGTGEFRKLLQGAWNYANDCLMIRTCVSEEPEAIACACISLATERCSVRLPDGWTEGFGVSGERVGGIMQRLRGLGNLRKESRRFVDYTKNNVLYEMLEKGKEKRVNGAKGNMKCGIRRERNV